MEESKKNFSLVNVKDIFLNLSTTFENKTIKKLPMIGITYNLFTFANFVLQYFDNNNSFKSLIICLYVIFHCLTS